MDSVLGVSETWTFAAAGGGQQLLSARSCTFTYDAAGNLTQRACPGGKTTTCTCDALDRLTNVSLPSGGTVAYTYDVLGQRIAKKVNEVITRFIFHRTRFYDPRFGRFSQADVAGFAKRLHHRRVTRRNAYRPAPIAYLGPPSIPYNGPAPRGGRTVPVTAKLSRKFYDAFGDEVAGELVHWMNATDTAIRLELREQSEARFRALRADWRADLAAFESRLGSRMDSLEHKVDGLGLRVDGLERRIGAIEQRLTPIEAQSAGLNERFSTLEALLLARIQFALADAKVEMVRWLVALWAAMTVTFIGIAFGIVRALSS